MPLPSSLPLPSLHAQVALSTASQPRSVCCACSISLAALCCGVHGSGVNNADARLNTRTADTAGPMGYMLSTVTFVEVAWIQLVAPTPVTQAIRRVGAVLRRLCG